MVNFSLVDGDWFAKKFILAFDKEMPIIIASESAGGPTDRQLAIFDSLDIITTKLIKEIHWYSHNYCKAVDSKIGLNDEGIFIDYDNLHRHFKANEMMIPRIHSSTDNFFFISYECDWDKERGMQILIENMKVVVCGPHTTMAYGAMWNRVLNASPQSREAMLSPYIIK